MRLIKVFQNVRSRDIFLFQKKKKKTSKSIFEEEYVVNLVTILRKGKILKNSKNSTQLDKA